MVGPEVDKGGLFNEIAEGQVYPHNDKWYSHLLDQYKLYVEMADRISSRRATANSYFLSVNSAILAFVGYLTSKDATAELWLLAAAGVTFVMGVPGADDVMLNYQSTSFHDALSAREIFGLKRAPEFEGWLAEMGITDASGRLAPPRSDHPLIAAATQMPGAGS